MKKNRHIPRFLRVIYFVLSLVGYLFNPLEASDSISSPTLPGTSARSLALGAIEGLNPSAYAIFENPASLPSDTKRHYSFFYRKLADSESTYLNFSTSYPVWGGTLGLGISQQKTPNLDNTAMNGDGDFYSESTFSIQENFYKLGYAKSIKESLTLGTSFHYYTNDLHVTSGSGWNIDTGLLYNSSPFMASITLKNIIPHAKVDFSEDYPSLTFPMDLVLSGKYQLVNRIAILGQFSAKEALKAGAVQYSPVATLDLLMGIREIEAAGRHTQLSLGASLKLPICQLNFSYQKSEVVGSENLFGFSLDIGI